MQNEDDTRAAYERDAVIMARNTPYTRHTVGCSVFFNGCDCWVIHAAYEALVRRFGPPIG